MSNKSLSDLEGQPSNNDPLIDFRRKLNLNNESNSTVQLRLGKSLEFESLDAEFGWDLKSITSHSSSKVIVQGFQGKLKKNESLAILGASGAGKTTFLSFLGNQLNHKQFKVDGYVTFLKQKMKRNYFKYITGFVSQEDVLDNCLTPKELLMLYAKLKIQQDKVFLEDQVRKIIKEMDIEDCCDTIIGDSLKKTLSGGEKKRTCIGIELLSNAPVIILDEPTTGLDSNSAYRLIQTLCNLNRIVIFTIHQPSSEIFDLIDKLLIVSEGRAVYFGNKNKIGPFFEYAGRPIPEFYNPFEHMIEFSNSNALNPISALEAESKYKKFALDKQIALDDDITVSGVTINEYINELKSHRYSSSYLTQCIYLFMKFIIISIRNRRILIFKVVQFNIIGLLFALVFCNLGEDLQGSRNKQGFINQISSAILFNATSSIILICKL